jgi:hypothetical protein
MAYTKTWMGFMEPLKLRTIERWQLKRGNARHHINQSARAKALRDDRTMPLMNALRP